VNLLKSKKNRMNNKLKIINKKLRLFFIVIVLLSVSIFLIVLNHVTNTGISINNVNLEQFAIILTLAGIPFSLWFFHSRLKKADKNSEDEYLNKYKTMYIIRLAILFIVCSFNIISLYLTGAKNFIFMCIITIFAFFLCLPQKEFEITETDNNEGNDDNDEII